MNCTRKKYNILQLKPHLSAVVLMLRKFDLETIIHTSYPIQEWLLDVKFGKYGDKILGYFPRIRAYGSSLYKLRGRTEAVGNEHNIQELQPCWRLLDMDTIQKTDCNPPVLF